MWCISMGNTSMTYTSTALYFYIECSQVFSQFLNWYFREKWLFLVCFLSIIYLFINIIICKFASLCKLKNLHYITIVRFKQIFLLIKFTFVHNCNSFLVHRSIQSIIWTFFPFIEVCPLEVRVLFLITTEAAESR